jgi:hypothetical protein
VGPRPRSGGIGQTKAPAPVRRRAHGGGQRARPAPRDAQGSGSARTDSEIVVATHRSRRKAHPEVVRKQLLDCPAHQLPDRPVRQFGVHLPSASIDTDKGLERQIIQSRWLRPPSARHWQSPGNGGGLLVDGRIPQNRLDAVEVATPGDMGQTCSWSFCRPLVLTLRRASPPRRASGFPSIDPTTNVPTRIEPKIRAAAGSQLQ